MFVAIAVVICVSCRSCFKHFTLIGRLFIALLVCRGSFVTLSGAFRSFALGARSLILSEVCVAPLLSLSVFALRLEPVWVDL